MVNVIIMNQGYGQGLNLFLSFIQTFLSMLINCECFYMNNSSSKVTFFVSGLLHLIRYLVITHFLSCQIHVSMVVSVSIMVFSFQFKLGSCHLLPSLNKKHERSNIHKEKRNQLKSINHIIDTQQHLVGTMVLSVDLYV